MSTNDATKLVTSSRLGTNIWKTYFNVRTQADFDAVVWFWFIKIHAVQKAVNRLVRVMSETDLDESRMSVFYILSNVVA